MYNTKFNVKYNDIEEELTHKLKKKTQEEYNENPDDEYEYSNQDVLDICNKLYRDEILSVFYAEDLIDDNIDQGMKYVYDIMITNEKFKQLLIEMEDFFKIENGDNIQEKQENIRHLILVSLFSQHIFYITHKCICQQIESGFIDDDLLVKLRKYSIDLLKNEFDV